MTITKPAIAHKIVAYLQHELTLAQLVDWAETALLEADVSEPDSRVLSDVIARLGLADVKSFGLTWEDCEEMLRKLGFSTRVELIAV